MADLVEVFLKRQVTMRTEQHGAVVVLEGTPGHIIACEVPENEQALWHAGGDVFLRVRWRTALVCGGNNPAVLDDFESTVRASDVEYGEAYDLTPPVAPA